jgi:hypothetical protein
MHLDPRTEIILVMVELGLSNSKQYFCGLEMTRHFCSQIIVPKPNLNGASKYTWLEVQRTRQYNFIGKNNPV